MASLRPVGDLLREWRCRRGLRQLALATEAEISARHLSFLETGRSSPSRDMLLRLAEQLQIPLRERNVLLTAGGFAAVFPERQLADPALDVIRKAIDVILIAHSMGCGELVRYFSRHGGRGVAGIVMVAPITPGGLKTADNPDGADSAALEKAREALGKDRPHVIAAAAPAFFGAPKNPVSAEMMQWWTDMLLQCSMKVLLQLHRVFTATDFRPDLQTISLPTLIIQGDCDTSTPLELTGRKTAALIPGSQLKVYENAAHGLPVTHAERLNHDLLVFASS
jgi:pimeloyl-ACP methyl ester carboxylesterase